MSELGWTPSEESVVETMVESAEAELLENASLESLKEKAESGTLSEEEARQLREMKQDRRLEMTPAEHARAKEMSDILTWVLIGIGTLIVIGGALSMGFFGFLF